MAKYFCNFFSVVLCLVCCFPYIFSVPKVCTLCTFFYIMAVECSAKVPQLGTFSPFFPLSRCLPAVYLPPCNVVSFQ